MAPRPRTPSNCPHCARPLTALQAIQGQHCDSLDCQRQSARQAWLQRRDATLAQQREQAAQRWQQPDLGASSVLWLPAHEAPLARLPAARRSAHLAHLQGLAAALQASPDAPPPTPTPPADNSETPAPSHPLAAALCAFCAGRCCRYGAASHAFITADLLKRWLAQHPGHAPEDAAAAYAQRLPAWHAAGSCVYHGRQGCTLPAAWRADICNQHACDTLQRLKAQAPGDAPLVAMQTEHRLLDVVWLQPEGPRRLPRPRAHG
jgi:hypothetical protein